MLAAPDDRSFMMAPKLLSRAVRAVRMRQPSVAAQQESGMEAFLLCMVRLYSVSNTSYDAESASLQRPIVRQLRWLTNFCLTIGDLLE